jgi:hypothetical protein
VNAATGSLLYSERIDFTGQFKDFSSLVIPEQGRMLSLAFLDKPTNWYFIAAAVLVGAGLIYWIFSTWATSSSSQDPGNPPIGPGQ